MRIPTRGGRFLNQTAGKEQLSREYAIYDVFTDKLLTGNPLAVVFDAAGLDEARMQAIAGEFNLSETVFVLPPDNGNHSAKVRIFTTTRELPFAGHPTVGSAIALAESRHGIGSVSLDLVQVLEEPIGLVRCAVRLEQGGPGFCEFDLPRLSTEYTVAIDRDEVAAALAVAPHEIGFENHVIGCWSAGVPFVMVPLRNLSAVERAKCDPSLWEGLAPIADGQLAFAYVYCRGGQNHGAAFHARMFAPHDGLTEDPATGSAAAALSGAIHRYDDLLDGHHSRLIEQGVEMGRPSLIHLHMDVEKGRIARARIGGQAVRIAQGTLSA